MAYGKSYADNEEEKTLIYHYDHLGSTRLVTDIDGKTICRFDYGTYGELLTTEYMSDGSKTTDASRIKFLYNGQLGVITDDNGLYYMRSRYYNPEIKRFINQDILTGSIGNSASLNRYSYVEGNPVSYTDPFGLSPFRAVHDVFHELFYIPVIGHGIAAIDALIYLAEGEYIKAGVSAIYAIPGGTGVGLVIETTAGATAFFLPDDMVKNHDNPIIQDLYEYSHYDEMSRGQIALYTIINGISAYGELKVFNTEPVYEGDYIDFNDPEVRKRFNNNGVKDSDFVNAGETNYGKSSEKLNWDNVISRKGETRVEHVMLHETNDLTKAEHGVFYGNAKYNIDKAWNNRTNGYKMTNGDKDIYIIPYENAGYSGDYGGQGNNLNYITITIQKNTSNIITG